MDSKILQKLTSIKQKFRSLSPFEREKISVALLKINLGVNGADEMLTVRHFLEDLEIDLKPESLDGFMGYLHSSSSNIPVNMLDHTRPEDLPEYKEDEVETLKEGSRPFPKKT